jgi:hypothetical protein
VSFLSSALAETITLNYTGVVQSAFGNDTSLVGDTYTATYVFDTSVGLYNGTQTPNYIDVYGGSQYGAPSPLLFESITINGVTEVLSDPGYGELILCSVCAGANLGLEEVAGASSSMTNTLYASGLPFPPSLDASESFSVVSNTSGSHASRGQFSPDDLELLPESVDISVVPAPIAGAGLPGLIFVFAGGGLFGWWLRKRNAVAQTA